MLPSARFPSACPHTRIRGIGVRVSAEFPIAAKAAGPFAPQPKSEQAFPLRFERPLCSACWPFRSVVRLLGKKHG
jgi:hypothetical protein